jgi:chemotaxis protein MotB
MPLKSKKHSDESEHHHPPAHDDDSSHGEGGHDESNWLVSYADMMTLLCGFFIMLFSMAKMDEPKYDSFKEAMSEQFGGDYVAPSKEMAKYATEIIQELGIESQTIIKADINGVSIVFESTVFFETLSADVTQAGKTILTQLIKKIYDRQKNKGKVYKIVVEGHTDGRPIIGGIFPTNWELSGARAARVVRMFLDHGFNAEQLTAIGYADTHPQVNARTINGQWDEKALAKNRRVVLRILEPSNDSIPYPDKDNKSPDPLTSPSPQPAASTLPSKTPTNTANNAH